MPDRWFLSKPTLKLLKFSQKASVVSVQPGDFELKDLYKSQWRQVQGLADCFWKRWKLEYLANEKEKAG